MKIKRIPKNFIICDGMTENMDIVVNFSYASIFIS